MFSLVSHGLRSWKNARGIALLAIAALAIGIGSTTAIYTVIYAVLLKPLPFADPDRYFFVWGSLKSRPGYLQAYSYFDAQDTAARVRSAEAFGCRSTDAYNVTFNGQPLHVRAMQTAPGLMNALGVKPALGRWFGEPQAEPDGVVISHSLWERFGSDPQISGKPLSMEGRVYTIVGVMPASFRYPIFEADLWIPHNPTPDQIHPVSGRSYHYLTCVAKLKAGVPLQTMESELRDIQGQLAKEHPDDQSGEVDTVVVRGVGEMVTEDIRPTLLLLLAAAATLFLISCADVGSLLLARSVARARDTAVRIALGATRWQLGIQYFAEGLFVACIGAATGVLLSHLLVRVVLSLAAKDIPRTEEVGLNWQVLTFTLAVAILSAVLFSLVPLWQSDRTPARDALSDGARTSAGVRTRRLFRVFVIAEIALSAGLLAVGGLVVEQLRTLYRVRPGFDPTNVLTMRMTPPAAKFPKEEDDTAYQERLITGIRAIPGVEAAGFTWSLPMGGRSSGTMLWVAGQPRPDVAKVVPMSLTSVGGDYFHAMKIPLVEGRLLTDDETKAGSIYAVVINQSMARLLFPNGGAVGALLRSASFREEEIRLRVVGIVGDVRNIALSQPTRPEVYLSFRYGVPPDMSWTLRASLGADTLAREVRRVVSRIEPEQVIFDIRPMTELVFGSMARVRLQSFMVSFFAGSALLLASLGLYGVMAYSIRQRTTEIGTRMALGATSPNLIGLVIGEGLKMASVGTAAGILLILLLSRVLDTSSLGIQSRALMPFVIAAAVIAGLTILACFVPAWRATLLAPMIAIRNEPETMWQQARSSYKRLTQRLLVSREETGVDEGTLLSAAVDVGSQAVSFPEAIQSAVAALREAIHAKSAALLVRRSSGQLYRAIAAAPEAFGKEWTLPADLPIFRRLSRFSRAMAMTHDDIEVWIRWAQAEATAYEPGFQTLQRMDVAIAAPVNVKAEMVGVLLLGPPEERPAYTRAERRALRSVAAQFAVLIENGRLMERIVEQERLRLELLMASEVQKRLFPEQSPESSAVECAGLCLPARGVGGDYYDFLDLDDGAGNHQIGIALADVAGKGIAAALLMSVVQASLRSLTESNGASLAVLAGKINNLLHRSTGSSSYATFFYGQFHESTRRFRYVNAGHNPPFLLRRADGGIEELPAGGMVIGLFPQTPYEEASLELNSGDVFIVFSDGVTEALDPKGEEFGDARLKAILRANAHLPVDEMSSAILGELKAWMSDAPQHDDLTFVLMKVR